MRQLDRTVEGVLLVPYFQPYVTVAPGAVPKGELLTRPEVARPTEEFFSGLALESQFEVTPQHRSLAVPTAPGWRKASETR